MSTAEQGQFEFKGGRYGSKRVAGRDLQALFDRQPPTSPEAEMCLLGSMILDYRVIAEVIGLVPNGDSFYSESHAAIYDALVKLYDKHDAGDVVQLCEALKDKGVLEQIGGPTYLYELVNAVPSAVNAPHYARIVSEKARLRKLIDAAGSILHDAYHSGELGDDGALGLDGGVVVGDDDLHRTASSSLRSTSSASRRAQSSYSAASPP